MHLRAKSDVQHKFKKINNEDHHKMQKGHINKQANCAESAFDKTIIREQITTKQEIIKTSHQQHYINVNFTDEIITRNKLVEHYHVTHLAAAVESYFLECSTSFQRILAVYKSSRSPLIRVSRNK